MSDISTGRGSPTKLYLGPLFLVVLEVTEVGRCFSCMHDLSFSV